MAYHALAAKILHSLVHSAAVARSVADIRLMELIDINAVGAELCQRRIELTAQLIRGLCAALSRYVHTAAHIVQRLSDLFLAVAVRTRGIEESHTALICPANKSDRDLPTVALYRQRTECVLRNLYPCLSENNRFHTLFLSHMTRAANRRKLSL